MPLGILHFTVDIWKKDAPEVGNKIYKFGFNQKYKTKNTSGAYNLLAGYFLYGLGQKMDMQLSKKFFSVFWLTEHLVNPGNFKMDRKNRGQRTMIIEISRNVDRDNLKIPGNRGCDNRKLPTFSKASILEVTLNLEMEEIRYAEGGTIFFNYLVKTYNPLIFHVIHKVCPILHRPGFIYFYLLVKIQLVTVRI